jgi:uncharacterized membrane protein
MPPISIILQQIGCMEEEIKALQEEMKNLYGELRQAQVRLQLLSNRLHQLQKKKPVGVSSIADSTSRMTLENFIGLKLIHIVGIVVLVIGISIGVKYAIDRSLITEGARIVLAYAAGALLFLMSRQLRKKYTAFSAILFSGAMASLYFTTFAAFVYYALFPFAVAFAIMIALTLFTTYQALQYNRQEIALLGLVGAYGIPFLISRNTGDPALLFTYIAIINIAVVFLSYKRQWLLVVYMAQFITWLLLLGWTLTTYTTADRSTALFFAAFFLILFIIHALLRRILQKQPLTPWQGQQVLYNNIIFYFVLQSVFNEGQQPRAMVSASVCLLGAAQVLAFHFLFPGGTALKRMLLLFAVTLVPVFIAQQWDGLLVTLLWLATAVGLFAAGVFWKATWLRLASIMLMGLTLLKLLVLDSIRFNTIQKIISYISLGILLLVVSFFYQKFREKLFSKEN